MEHSFSAETFSDSCARKPNQSHNNPSHKPETPLPPPQKKKKSRTKDHSIYRSPIVSHTAVPRCLLFNKIRINSIQATTKTKKTHLPRPKRLMIEGSIGSRVEEMATAQRQGAKTKRKRLRRED